MKIENCKSFGMRKFLFLIVLFMLILSPVSAVSPDNIPIICDVKMTKSDAKVQNNDILHSAFFINDIKKELYTYSYGNKIHGTTNMFNKQHILITNGTDAGLITYVDLNRITGHICFVISDVSYTHKYEGNCSLCPNLDQQYVRATIRTTK